MLALGHCFLMKQRWGNTVDLGDLSPPPPRLARVRLDYSETAWGPLWIGGEFFWSPQLCSYEALSETIKLTNTAYIDWFSHSMCVPLSIPSNHLFVSAIAMYSRIHSFNFCRQPCFFSGTVKQSRNEAWQANSRTPEGYVVLCKSVQSFCFEKRHVATGGCRAQRPTEIASGKTQSVPFVTSHTSRLFSLSFVCQRFSSGLLHFRYHHYHLSENKKQDGGEGTEMWSKGLVFFYDLVKEKEVSDIKAGLPSVFGPKKKTELLLESSRSLD